MRRRVEAGHTWERSTEWNSVRALLAHEAQTEMGRELAATAEPLTDPHAVRAELEETRQARLALATSSPLPLHGIPDIRPALSRCHVARSLPDGPELALLAPACTPSVDRADPIRRDRAQRQRQPRPRPGGARRRARDRPSSGRPGRRGPRAHR